LLSLNDEALPFSISGTTDLVIADKLFAKAHDLRGGLHVGFEIKKKIQDFHIYQAIGELKVMQCPTTLQYAINIIETAFVSDARNVIVEESGSIQGATVTNPVAMRINFRNFRDGLRDNLPHENEEEDGLKQFFNRPK
ncbi:4497_t:CDS:2, partial [Racocetra fulgida]